MRKTLLKQVIKRKVIKKANDKGKFPKEFKIKKVIF